MAVDSVLIFREIEYNKSDGPVAATWNSIEPRTAKVQRRTHDRRSLVDSMQMIDAAAYPYLPQGNFGWVRAVSGSSSAARARPDQGMSYCRPGATDCKRRSPTESLSAVISRIVLKMSSEGSLGAFASQLPGLESVAAVEKTWRDRRLFWLPAWQNQTEPTLLPA